MADTNSYIRVGDTLTNILSSQTGANLSYNKVTTWKDGSLMDDSKCDGVIYRKLGTEYFRMNGNILSVRDFGAKGDGVTDDTAAFQACFGAVYQKVNSNLGGNQLRVIADIVDVPYTPFGYKVSGEITFYSGLTVNGNGSLVFLADDANVDVLFKQRLDYPVTQFNQGSVRMFNLNIDGKFRANKLMALTRTNGSALTDCFAKNFKAEGIALYDAQFCVFTNVHVFNCPIPLHITNNAADKAADNAAGGSMGQAFPSLENRFIGCMFKVVQFGVETGIDWIDNTENYPELSCVRISDNASNNTFVGCSFDNAANWDNVASNDATDITFIRSGVHLHFVNSSYTKNTFIDCKSERNYIDYLTTGDTVDRNVVNVISHSSVLVNDPPTPPLASIVALAGVVNAEYLYIRKGTSAIGYENDAHDMAAPIKYLYTGAKISVINPSAYNITLTNAGWIEECGAGVLITDNSISNNPRALLMVNEGNRYKMYGVEDTKALQTSATSITLSGTLSAGNLSSQNLTVTNVAGTIKTEVHTDGIVGFNTTNTIRPNDNVANKNLYIGGTNAGTFDWQNINLFNTGVFRINGNDIYHSGNLPKIAAQADSTATDVAGLVADFNALLAKMRAAGYLNT